MLFAVMLQVSTDDDCLCEMLLDRTHPAGVMNHQEPFVGLWAINLRSDRIASVSASCFGAP